MDNQIIEDAISYITELFKMDYSGHDCFHTIRVFKTASKIAYEEGADIFIVQLASLLHDVDDMKLSPETYKHKEKAVSFMKEHSIKESIINEVINIITEVSFVGNDSIIPTTLEGKCVQDADRLDAMGAIGIARAFAYGGSHDRMIYNPKIEPQFYLHKENYYKNTSTTINHFYEKLFKLKELMNTEEAKLIAQHRENYMYNFINQFFKEWNGIE